MNLFQAKVNVLGRLYAPFGAHGSSHRWIPFGPMAARDALLPSPCGDDIPQGDDVRVG